MAEIASKEFVDEMSSVIKSSVSFLFRASGDVWPQFHLLKCHLDYMQTTSPEVKQMALKFFQQWALAFESKKELSFFVDVYHELKNSGETAGQESRDQVWLILAHYC